MMQNVDMKCDILVVGGGISGCMAAISAARCGKDVLLVERYGFLGGTLVANGTGPMMTFHAGDKQVVKGITGELIDRLYNKGKSVGHIFDTTCYTYTVTPFDAEGMKAELEQMLTEAGGRILYHSFVCSVERDEREITKVMIAGKDGFKTIKAKVYVDASGDADISRFAGLKTHLGRKEDGKCQPLTLNMKLYNVDIPKVKAYIKAHPEDFGRMDTGLVDQASRLSVGGFDKTFAGAIRMGAITFDREFLLFFETNNPGEVIINTTRVSGINPLKPEELTLAEMEGRRQCEEVYQFLRSQIAGFENAVIAYTGPFIGVRGSVQIEGCYTINEMDIVSCKEFEDTVAHGAYPIDIHPPEGADEGMFDVVKLQPGDYYSIPYRALIGKMHNLITVGRCISATFEAQAAIRVSPIAGAIGHAGGVAAAVAVQQACNVQSVRIEGLRRILAEQGAFLENETLHEINTELFTERNK